MSAITDTTTLFFFFLEIQEIPIMGGLLKFLVAILFALSKENALFMHYLRKSILP